MSMFLLAYDLPKPGQDYNALEDVLKGAANSKRILRSTWLLTTKESIETWNNKLKEVVDDNDRFFLTDITDQPCKAFNTRKKKDN